MVYLLGRYVIPAKAGLLQMRLEAQFKKNRAVRLFVTDAGNCWTRLYNYKLNDQVRAKPVFPSRLLERGVKTWKKCHSRALLIQNQDMRTNR